MRRIYAKTDRRLVNRGTVPVDPVSLQDLAGISEESVDKILEHSDHDALREAMDRLDPEYKKVLVMHYFGELPVKQIATVMNVPVGTVLWRLNIARKILARDLGAKLGKKTVAVLLAALLGISTLFGALVSPLGDWVAEKVFGSAPAEATQVESAQSGELTSGDDGIEPGGEERGALATAPQADTNVISETQKQEGEDSVNISAKIRKTVAAASLVTMGLVGSASATTYYVAKGGDDGNDGSSEHPFASVSKGLEAAAAGDTVVVGEGTWEFAGSMTLSKAITLRGSGDRETVFSGGDGTTALLTLNKTGLVVENLTVSDCQITGATASIWQYPPAGVEIKAGWLKNCTVRNCQPKDPSNNNASAVRLTGSTPGKMSDCAITNNLCGLTQASYGAVVIDNESTIENCEIAWNRGRAAVGLFINLYGTVTGCNIHDNRALTADEMAFKTVGNGAGVRIDGGTLKNSFVTNNVSAGGGGGIWARGGTIENCVIANNTAAGNGGGIIANAGTTGVRFCNIGGNTCGGSATGAGVSCEDATLNCINDIIYGNFAPTADKELNGGAYWYCYLPVEKSGAGNIKGSASPFQADGSYLTVTSAAFPGVDKATEIDGVTTDILGRTRPIFGITAAKSDIGCCEFDPSALDATVTLTASAAEIAVGGELTFALEAKGFGENARVTWDFGDGSETVETDIVDSLPHVFGVCAKGLQVKATVTDDQGRRVTGGAVITVYPREVFVAANAGNEWPYDTPAKAARSVDDAVANCRALGGERRIVTFAGGTYAFDAHWTAPANALVRGSGERGTTLTVKSSTGDYVLRIDSASTTVSNLVVSGGSTTGSSVDKEAAPSGVRMGAGLLVDCEISNCTVLENGKAGNALALVASDVSRPPVAERCRIVSNIGFKGTAVSGTYPRGSAVYLQKGGVLHNCEVAHNTGRGGVTIPDTESTGALVEDCNIHHNTSDSTGVGVLMFSGTVRNTRICDNESTGATGGGVRALGGTYRLENCLIARNRALQDGGGCHLQSAGSDCQALTLHCTVANNVSQSGVGGVWMNQNVDGLALVVVVNSIISGNAGANGANEVKCDFGEIRNSWTSGDPLFEEDFTLGATSPCIDAAVDAEGMTLATDIDGTERPIDGDNDGEALPDMGCYEMPYRAPPELSARFTLVPADVVPNEAVNLSATVISGTPTAETLYAWDFGDGTRVTNAGVATATHAYAAGGRYTVSLTVLDEQQGWDLDAGANVASVHVDSVYVAPEGEGAFPYDTPERATSDIAAAVAAARPTTPGGLCTVNLVAGTYRLDRLEVTGSTVLRGAGCGRTVIDLGTGEGIRLDNVRAQISDLTVSNFNHTAVTVKQGTLDGCTVTCGWPRQATDEVHGLVMEGLHDPENGSVCIVTNCVVSSVMATNAVAKMPLSANGAGVRITGAARLARTTICDCRCDFGDDATALDAADRTVGHGGGIAIDGAVRVQVDGCDILRNFAGLTGGGVSTVGEVVDNSSLVTISNCRILGNGCRRYAGAAVRFDRMRSTLVGCYVAENFRTTEGANNDTSGAGVFCRSPYTRVVNCTIVGNHGGSYGAGVVFHNDCNSGGVLANTIVWGNFAEFEDVSGRAADVVVLAGAVVTAEKSFAQTRTYVDGSAVTETDVWETDPCLRADGTLKSGSPARNAGGTTHWRSEWTYGGPEVDYFGRARTKSSEATTMDVGAFAYKPVGLIITFQ